MLQYDIARMIYEEIKAKSQKAQPGFEIAYKLFLESAVDYAHIRTSWAGMDQAARNEADKGRRIKHDAFIAILNAICRNLGMTDVEEHMPDRKTKGDFACYIALFLGLEQR